jgi:ABC-type Fe3+/spermidine/putrescine transport system ATPase subunit
MPPRLAVRDIAKHYGGVQALRGVSLHVEAGEVLGLVGDNSAGKSTMAKILSGATFPSAGQVLLDGRPVEFPNPAAARDAGVASVYQDLALAGQRDVVANFFLGREILSGHWPSSSSSSPSSSSPSPSSSSSSSASSSKHYTIAYVPSATGVAFYDTLLSGMKAKAATGWSRRSRRCRTRSRCRRPGPGSSA